MCGKTESIKNVSTDFLKPILLFAVALLCSLLFSGANVKAASNRTLNTDQTYTAYDVTGDGVADTIKLTKGGYSYDMYTKLYITVNGSTAYTYTDTYYTWAFDYNVSLITLKNGKVYLFVCGSGENGDGSGQLLQYKKSTKTFKKVADLGSLFTKYGYHVSSYVKKVSGNKIVIHVIQMSYSLAGVAFDVTFNYKSGKLVRSGKMTITDLYSGRTLTTNKKLTAYTSAALTKKAASIKKGKKVYISALYYKNGKMSAKVKVNGKYRWIKCLTSYPSTEPFKNLMYAG